VHRWCTASCRWWERLDCNTPHFDQMAIE
jgi:hypothetical protein